MESLPLRIAPGQDLREALESAVAAQGVEAAFVLSGIGSLSSVALRLAGQPDATEFEGAFEVLTLAGTIGVGGSHLHISVADAQGRVFGGHAARGCIVRTTAEVLLALMPEWSLTREMDPATGYAELKVRRT